MINLTFQKLMAVNKCYYEISTPRGYGLIIINIFNNVATYTRNGAVNERENLEKLFKSMGLEVIVAVEKTRNEMFTFLQGYAQQSILKEHSMIAIAISSHGCEEGVLGINIEERLKFQMACKKFDNPKDIVRIQDIRSMFNAQHCPNLAGKPKLLIINGCRGSTYETLISTDIPNVSSFQANTKFTKSTTWSDFFTLFSCVQGHYSLRCAKSGSFYINALLKTYNDYGKNLSIDEMLPIVNQCLIENISSEWNTDLNQPYAESCHWESTCTRILKIEPVENEDFDASVAYNLPPSVTVQTKSQLSPSSTTGTYVREKTLQFETSMKCNWSICNKNTSNLNSLPYQINHPTGVSICGDIIYILDSIASRIWLFKTNGEQILIQTDGRFMVKSITHSELHNAWGVLAYNDSIVVTKDNALIMFSKSKGSLDFIEKVTMKVSGLDYHNSAGLLYVCDRPNLCLVTYDLKLKEVARFWLTIPEDQPLSAQSGKTRLLDVKCLEKNILTLISQCSCNIYIFDYNGVYVRSIISINDIPLSGFFAVNHSANRIAIGDAKFHNLKIFDMKGDLVNEMCAHGDGVGEFNSPTGIAFDQNDNVVIACSAKQINMIQSFDFM